MCEAPAPAQEGADHFSRLVPFQNVARRSGAALGVDKGTKYATRQKQALKDLQKSRDDLKSGRVYKETKLKKMEQEQSWDKLADAVNDVFVAPLQKMTGACALLILDAAPRARSHVQCAPI
jgi:hypothetical protein